MRHLILSFLALCLLISPVEAQNNEAELYIVNDVAVDVTADSAAHARDQAIIQAQHSALGQVAERVGADPSVATKISDDDLATLVQSFEVQEEHTSAVRYIGTFTVQFRSAASHTFLAGHGATFAVTRGEPVVVLPVVNTSGHHILFEETTKWRTAWETAAHNTGMVPVIIPTGDLDDIAALSTDEAVSGKASALKAIMDKYQATSIVVATLNLSDTPATDGLRIDIQNYDSKAAPQLLSHITLSAPSDKNATEAALVQGIKQIRSQMEKDWKQLSKSTKTVASTTPSPAPALIPLPPPVDTNLEEPMVTLPLTVPLIGLTEWAQIRARLNSIPSIRRTNVITLARGATSLELSFTGSLEDLRIALLDQGLILNKNMANGGWVLRPAEPGETL